MARKGKKYGPAREHRSSETITQLWDSKALQYKIPNDAFQSALVKMGTGPRADTAREKSSKRMKKVDAWKGK